MDPNTALDQILRGNNVVEHTEALGGWLVKGGFAPAERALPEQCAPFVDKHCERHYDGVPRSEIRVHTTTIGLWTRAPGTKWIALAIWRDLLRLEN